MGWKKKEERALFKNRISAGTEKEEGEKKQPKKDPILEREWGRNIRTLLHPRHFPDLPGGEITIEGTSTTKHCTTNKEKSKEKNGLEKKRGESIVQKKNQCCHRKKKGINRSSAEIHVHVDPILEREGRECTYCVSCSSLPRPAMWRGHH